MMGRGKKGRGAPALSLFPIAPCALTIPYFFFIFNGILSGSLSGVGGGGKRSKGTFFFFKEIAGKMVRHELTNIERQEN